MPGVGVGDDSGDGEPASRREARYRTRLRDSEARLRAAADENVDLQNRLEAMQWTEAVRMASARLADPEADLFRDHWVDEVLADDGSVDPQRVDALVDTILSEYPHYAAPRPSPTSQRRPAGRGRSRRVPGKLKTAPQRPDQ